MIDNALYQAPQGIESLSNEPDIEIEIVNPEGVKIDMDGVEIESFRWIKPRAALRLRLNTYTRRAVNDIVNNRKLRTD